MEVAIGIDIGATKCAAGIVTRNGGLLDREVIQVNHRASSEELYDDLAQIVASQLSKAVDNTKRLQLSSELVLQVQSLQMLSGYPR